MILVWSAQLDDNYAGNASALDDDNGEKNTTLVVVARDDYLQIITLSNRKILSQKWNCKGDGGLRYQEEWSSDHDFFFFFYMLFRGSKIYFLVWRSFCSFPLMSSPANLPFKCARESVLHCEQLMTASNPSSTHDDCEIREFSNRSLEECKTCERRWWWWWQGVGIARWRAREAWQRLAAPRYAKVRQGLYYSLPATYIMYPIVVEIFYEGVEQGVRKRS
jgi:hypothetical protein